MYYAQELWVRDSVGAVSECVERLDMVEIPYEAKGQSGLVRYTDSMPR